MNIIEELVEKYGGKYSAEQSKNIYTPNGRFSFNPKKGLIEINGSKFLIKINAVAGAIPIAEPFRIILFLTQDYPFDNLEISPLTYLQKISRFIFLSNSYPIKKQFLFRGYKPLIKVLLNDIEFYQNLIDEKVYLRIDRENPQHLILTPAFGIKDLTQVEKHLEILKTIETKIKVFYKK